MMKRYLLSIILGFFALANISYSQVQVNFSSETANTNETVDIDVTVNGFTNISILQFTASWDSMVMTFNSIPFTNPALQALMESNFGTPMGSAGLDEGQFTLSYGGTEIGTLPDGEILFTVRFDVVGNECDETTLELTNVPTPIDAYDNNLNQLTVSSVPGSLLINGPDCGTSEDELTFIVGDEDMITADAGSSICIPITVENFIDIQTGTGTILWDPTVISYTGLANIAINGLSGSLNETNTDNGELKFIWSNLDPGNPLTLADGDTVFEICFDVVGEVGDMSPITLSEQGSLGFEWGNNVNNELPLDLKDGKLTITEMVEDPFILNVSNETIDEDESNVCVSISVENFNNLLGMQFVVTWDETILTNATPTNFNLDGLNTASFNIDGNCATMSWNVNFGINVADGTNVFDMCFDVIGPCPSMSAVELVAKGSTSIEILDGNTMPIPPPLINQGSVTVNCISTDPCDMVSVLIDDTCNGELGGNVTVDIPLSNCTYSWADGTGDEVSTEKNLLGVAAGTYILTIFCDDDVTCTLPPATVENFPDLIIDDGNPMNAACGDKGSLDVTVSFGSGNYSYNWDPAQADSPNISDLDADTYLLTVTDNDNGCTQIAEFEILDVVEPLVINAPTVIDETCQEVNGRISLTIEGGCQPYTFEWSDMTIGNTPTAANLAAGIYGVTVTDDLDNIAMASYEVDGSDPITQLGTADITPSSGSNGSISFMVTGGDPDYSYNWSGPTSGLSDSNSVSSLMDGTYTVVVTDSKGCTETFTFIVPFFNGTIDSVMVGTIEAVNDANGFSVICNGDTNGVIVGNISAGEMPYTIDLTGDETRTFELDDPGTFTIDNLSAGTYNVSVSNTVNSVSVSVVISEPDPLISSVEQGCDSEEQCDGFIDLNISGGFGDLTIDWGNEDLVGESLDDLCVGSYTAITTDENGCERMDAVEIESCEGPINPDCYEVRDVITPNGDGMNDQFTVTCISDFPASLEIFDRWGKLVFSQDVYDGTWMGISNSNEELIEGGYMYIINIDFGQGRREIMKGTITLLRD